MSANTQPVLFAIKGIKEIEFFANEFVDLGESFDFNYQVEIKSDIPEELVLVTITPNYLLKGSETPFMRSKVMTIFTIKDLKLRERILDDGTQAVDLPDPVWVSLFSIAFTHARALLAKSSASTKYAHMILPLINPEIEFKKIFAKDFLGSASSPKRDDTKEIK